MNENQKTQGMEAKEICFYILRRWRLILAAALIGAVLLGGYFTAMRLVKGPMPILSEEELEKSQEELDEAEEEVRDTQESIQIKTTELSDYRDSVVSYEAILNQAQDNSRVTASQAMNLVELHEKIAEKKSAIASTTQRINELEQYIVDLQEDMAELREDMEETAPAYTTKGIVMGFASGGILGMAFVVFFVFVGLAFRKNLRNGEELGAWYELPLLCDLYASATSGKRHSYGRIDRWLDRLEGIESNTDPDAAFAVAAAKLQLLVEPDVPVVLAGTADREKMDTLYKAMRQNLPAQMEFLVAGNPMKQPEAVQQLAGAVVVLVEEAGVSNNREVRQTVEFLRLSNTRVIAAAVL